MKNIMRRVSALILVPLAISCATITVNVYFPDKDVEAAYEDIEKGLDFDVTPTRKDTSTVAPAKKSKNRSDALFGSTAAWAEPKININAELEKMDDVQASLERRKERIEVLGRLLNARLAGLSNIGMIVRINVLSAEEIQAASLEVFGDVGSDTASRMFDSFISDENADRKILVRGMAIATLRATDRDEKDKSALAEAIEKSSDLFSKQRVRKLQTGWYYQNDAGQWVQVAPPEEKKGSKK